MNPNLTQEQLKQQASMIGQMSDEQLKTAAAQAGNVNPMLKNMDPAMMRQASEMMKNMSPDQMAQMQKMAQQMMGGGGMPGTFPNVPPTQQQQQQIPTAPPSNLSESDQRDLKKADALKNEAAVLVKEKNLAGACVKYFAAINTVRLNDSLKHKKEGKTLDIACRSNIAHCKLQLKEYDQVIDQCEKVLEYEPDNSKCQFRMATAIWSMPDRNDTQVKSAFNWISKCRKTMSGDKSVQTLFDEIKLEHDRVLKKENQLTEERKESKQSASTKEKLLSRVIIPDDEPVIEEVKSESQKKQPQEKTTQPQTYIDPNLMGPNVDMQQNLNMINQMGDDQLNNMVNMMRSNPALVRAQYENLHGTKFTDEQFNQMMANLTPETIRQGTTMAQQNPEMLRQAKELQEKQKQQKKNEQGSQLYTETPYTAPQVQQQAAFPQMGAGGMPDMSNMADMMNNPMVKEMMNNPEMMKMAQQMMGGMGGNSGAMPDASKMQDMMKNPSMSKMLENPDFLANTLNMLKSPMAKGQLDAVAQQTGMSSSTIIRCLEWLVSLAYMYNRVRPVLPIIKYGFILLVIALIARWMGYL